MTTKNGKNGKNGAGKNGKAVTPIAIANYLLSKGVEATPLKLTKLAFLCHSWHLGINGAPMSSETAEAWRSGPSFRSLHYATRDHAYEFVPAPIGRGWGKHSHPLSEAQREIADAVIRNYGDKSGMGLVKLFHQKDTPWDVVYNQLDLPYTPIPDAIIRDHYASKLNGQE